MRRVFPDIEFEVPGAVVSTTAHVCRDEWLFEIESDALKWK